MNFRKVLTLRWILTTMLVLAAMGVMIRLGFWQLDRLAQRKAFNARILAQVNAPTLNLAGATSPADLTGMEYRKVTVTGEYDFGQQIVLKNQYWNGQIGVHLLTPLHISGNDQAVLIDRGWVPGENPDKVQLSQYDQVGQVEVQGVIRLSQPKAILGLVKDPTPAPGQSQIMAWNLIEIPLIQKQMPYQLLPVYVQESPNPASTALPYQSELSLNITNGPHLSYAIQWFSFSAMLGLGYPFFVRRQLRRQRRNNELPQEALRSE